MKSLSAAVLTVGTEITSGEILNSNSRWLADQLEKLGLEVTIHLSVPDDRKLIAEAFNFCSSWTQVLVVTGGLGPTSDDFTREVIADWAGAPLQFHDGAWKDLEIIYAERKIALRPAHRQQCYFPKSALLLKNIVGTAHGFYLKTPKVHFVVLPGPPREISGMWQASVEPVLQSFNSAATTKLYRWICFGVPESEVAEEVEKIIAGKGLKVGYRASKPFIHVKLWIPLESDSSVLAELDKALSRWQVHDGKDREDG